MTPTEAGALIRVLERDLRVARAARAAMLAILLLGIVAAIASPKRYGQAAWLTAGAMTAALSWAVLTIVSLRQMRTANQALRLVVNGKLELAELQLREALRAFTIYSGAKLLACHNLAVVAHGRGEFAVAAELCDGILRRSSRYNRRTARTTRMLLADCRLSLQDVPAARTALGGLKTLDADLSLTERVMLLPVQVRCEVMSMEFEAAAAHLGEKVRLAELLESPRAALVHALLGDACKALQRLVEAGWLRRRAELYHELTDLEGRYPNPVVPEADVLGGAAMPGT